MFKKSFISLKNIIARSHAYIENNISFFSKYFHHKTLNKKLNSLIDHSNKVDHNKTFLVDGHFYNYGYFYSSSSV